MGGRIMENCASAITKESKVTDILNQILNLVKDNQSLVNELNQVVLRVESRPTSAPDNKGIQSDGEMSLMGMLNRIRDEISEANIGFRGNVNELNELI